MVQEKTMKVEIWSDIMCPFCYIGKRKFEQALTQFENKENIQVEWKSFLLDPDLKNEQGKNIHEVLAEKKGWTKDYAQRMNNHVAGMAKEVGLNYEFDKVKPANTITAHRLTHLAARHGLQDQMEEKLFRAYFTDGTDIGNIDALVELAVEVGLNEQEVRQVLLSDQFTEAVKADAYEAQEIGVRGVPFFVIDRKYAVSGAQPKEVFLTALETAWKEQKKEDPVAELDASCSIDGRC